MLVEKRIAGIIRWLERLKQSYSSGMIESALMDAECARADLENLRQDVWAQAKSPTGTSRTLVDVLVSSARTLSLALLIVMLSVVPLSREVYAPAVSEPLSVHAGPIIVIREYEPEKPEAVVAAPAQPKRQLALKRPAQKRAQTPAPQVQPKPQTSAGTVPPYDKVYSLIQTGQRALKNNSTVIKIQ